MQNDYNRVPSKNKLGLEHIIISLKLVFVHFMASSTRKWASELPIYANFDNEKICPQNCIPVDFDIFKSQS